MSRLTCIRDIKDIQGTYPFLIAGAPTDLFADMIQVKSLLVAYGVGLEVQFSGETLRQVQNYIKTAESTGGSVSIFGFDIGLAAGGSYQTTQTQSFDQLNFDSTSGTYSIAPEDNGYPILLGVVGQRLDPNKAIDPHATPDI